MRNTFKACLSNSRTKMSPFGESVTAVSNCVIKSVTRIIVLIAIRRTPK